MSVSPSLPNRRTVLAVGGSAAAAALVAACSSDPAEPAAGTPAGNAPAGSAATAGPLATVADIPDGGAVVADTVLLARTGDKVAGHEAICTHMKCALPAPASGDQVTCTCHGSQFNAATGAVLKGPAEQPLPEVAVTVKDGKVFRA